MIEFRFNILLSRSGELKQCPGTIWSARVNESTAGGAATNAGVSFQNRVAAWISVRILAGQDVAPLWGLPTGTALEFLRCETEQPVDDILVGTSTSGHIFIQVKHTVRMEKGPTSGIGAAINQFVRQFVTSRARTTATRPWERPLDPDRDRLVLTVGPGSSGAVVETLPAILARLSNLTPDQPVMDAATTQVERQICEIVLEHVERSWKGVVQTAPDEAERRQLLRLIRIQRLDVDADSPGEREAISTLAGLISQADNTAPFLAWTTLIELCGQFATSRSGGDRARLQNALLQRGIQIGPDTRYEADIARLRKLAVTVTAALAQLAEIRIGETTIKIDRAVAPALRAAAASGSVVVIGDPGAGKSGQLHDFAATLTASGADFVVLAVDRLAAQSLFQLRDELGLQHDLVDVLVNWPGTSPGYLIIDALDSARSESAAAGIGELVGSMIRNGERWRVVAAVRKFDLAKSSSLQPLFAGRPPEQPSPDPEFPRVRHVNVSAFDPAEIAQVSIQSAILGEVLARAHAALKELLRLPFNLRLVADMVSAGLPIEELSPIQTQISLLDKYWTARVVGNDQAGYVRENILRDVAQKMTDRRTMRVHVAELETTSTQNPELDELLRRQVLVHWSPVPGVRQRDVLAFAHNLLFDYAVGRLLFFSNGDRFIRFLEAPDADAVMAIRPSVVLSFQHYWYLSSDVFWDLVLRIERLSESPEIIRLIGPTVATELARDARQLQPLIAAIQRRDRAAQTAFRHLIGSLLASPADSFRGASEPVWANLAEAVSATLEDEAAYALATLLNLLMSPSPQSIETRAQVGRASRNLLSFVRRRPQYESWLSRNALTAVCRSYCTSAAESSILLRSCFDSGLLEHHGHEEIPTLAREAGPVLDCDPEFVAELYRTAFSHMDTSEATTIIGDAQRILTFTSTRRQDYELGRYQLAELFPEFVRRYPVTAFNVLIVVVAAYIRATHSGDSNEPDEAFEFFGRTAHIRRDYSEIWDSGGAYSHATPLQLLDILDSYITGLPATEASYEVIDQFLSVVAEKNVYATVWRRVLRSASHAASTLGKRVWPLACAVPILTGFDTYHVAGEYLSAAFSLLTEEQRLRIEEAILNIDAGESALVDSDRIARHRDRLLGCLPLDSVIAARTKARIVEMTAAGSVPPNEPAARITGGARPYTSEDHLARRGVPVDAPANRHIQELEKKIEPFNSQHLNSPPTLDEISAILSNLYGLRDALKPEVVSGIHEEQADYAWSVLAEACERIASSSSDWQAGGLGEFVRSTLLTAATNRVPLYTADDDKQFNRSPAWGGPSARISAAAGLVQSKPPLCSSEVHDSIRHLASDRVPAVRYQIAARLLSLYQHSADLMWELCREFGRNELNRGVLSAVTSVFARLAARFPDAIVPLAIDVYRRLQNDDGLDSPLDQCVSIFLGLALWQENPICSEIVADIVASPSKHSRDAHRLVLELEHNLNPEPGSDPARAEKIRRESFLLLNRMAENVVAESGVRERGGRAVDENVLEACAKIADTIGARLYFASGAFKGSNSTTYPMTPESRRQFFADSRTIIQTLSTIAIPSLTHHLLEILDHFADVQPRAILLDSALVLEAARGSRYATDSMAADLVANIVERFIADQRGLLRDDVEARKALIGILDEFVQMGWPRAQRLAYRLGEIYR